MALGQCERLQADRLLFLAEVFKLPYHSSPIFANCLSMAPSTPSYMIFFIRVRSDEYVTIMEREQNPPDILSQPIKPNKIW